MLRISRNIAYKSGLHHVRHLKRNELTNMTEFLRLFTYDCNDWYRYDNQYITQNYISDTYLPDVFHHDDTNLRKPLKLVALGRRAGGNRTFILVRQLPN